MTEETQPDTVTSGWVLTSSAILSIVLMFQHPSGADHGSVMTPVVHGGLQALMLAQVTALVQIARSMRLSLPVVFGLVAFITGQAAGVGAATINGFVVPALGAYQSAELAPEIGRLAWETNQALARLGAVAVGAGIFSLCVVFWQKGNRWLAVTGGAIGGFTGSAIASGLIDMNLHGASVVYIAQWIWLAGLGMAYVRKT